MRINRRFRINLKKTKVNNEINHDIMVGFNQNEGTYFTMYLYNEKFFDVTQQDPVLNKSQNDHLIKYDNNFVYERLLEALETKSPTSTTDSKYFNKHFYNKYVECVSNIYTFSNHNLYLNDYYNETYNLNLNTKLNLKQNSANLAWFKFNKIIGDIIFSCPSIKVANKYSELNPHKTFFYKFNKRSFRNPWPKWFGVSHGFEIEFVFGVPFVHVNYFDEDDRLISLKMMNFWSNFAKTGKL